MPENLNFDMTSVAGISAVAMFFVSTLKLLFEKQVKGREPIIAIAVGITLALAAKFGGTISFKPGVEGWCQVAGAALVAAVASQAGHDYVLNPVKGFWGGLVGFVKGLLKKKEEGGEDEPKNP